MITRRTRSTSVGFVVKRTASGYDVTSKTSPPLHAHGVTMGAAIASLSRDVGLAIQEGKIDVLDLQPNASACFVLFGNDLMRTVRYASDLALRSGASEIEPLHLANACRAANEQAAQQDVQGGGRGSARCRCELRIRLGPKANQILIEATRIAQAEPSSLVHVSHLRSALRETGDEL